jgi:TolA protein
MDRAEQIGLGSAVGGHALLLGLFALGVFQMTDEIKPPEPISVSLVSADAIEEDAAAGAPPETATLSPEELAAAEPVAAPVADNSEAEAAAQERAQAAAAEAAEDRQKQAEAQQAAQQKQAEAAAAAQAAAKAKADAARVSATAAEKQRAREAQARADQAKRDAAAAAERQRKQAADAAQKAAARKAAAEAANKKAAADAAKRAADTKARAAADAKAKAAAAKAQADAKRKADAARAKELEEGRKRLENAVNGAGGSGKTAAQVRGAVTIALGNQIGPRFQSCAPNGPEIEDIFTYMSLNIGKNGALISATIYDQKGVSPTNSAQAAPLKRCALEAARAASPFKGLDPIDYEVWKTHKMKLRAK